MGIMKMASGSLHPVFHLLHGITLTSGRWPKVSPGALGSPITRVDKVDRHHEVQPGLLEREGER